MKISSIVTYLETIAHPILQEEYDNAGLLTGNTSWECSGVIVSLDTTEDVVKEAVSKKCNLIVAHHPIIFKGLKKINGNNYIGKTIIAAIKNDIAIFAIHTNLDNVINGVNGKIASVLGLRNTSILSPRENSLKKLFTFVPDNRAEEIRDAIFNAGGGHIGNYSECSFNTSGTGTFKGNKDTQPYVGNTGERHQENETRIEVVFPAYLENSIIKAMKEAHPYEEAAYDIIALSNTNKNIGSGLIGELEKDITETDFLDLLKRTFKIPVIKHSAFTGNRIKKVAVCGGAGSFLVTRALSTGAEAYVTADMKYHEFFDANDKLMIADIGHFESEQFTIDLLKEILEEKFPTFAVLKTGIITNPVNYFI